MIRKSGSEVVTVPLHGRIRRSERVIRFLITNRVDGHQFNVEVAEDSKQSVDSCLVGYRPNKMGETIGAMADIEPIES
jgi:hypothetical protein